MTTGAYCDNAGCSHEFDKPSFAEITARKRECPACGAINYVSDDLGTALDAAFAEVAELITTESKLAKTETRLHGSRPDTVIIDDELPGVWQASDFYGGATDCDVAAGTTVPQEMRKTDVQTNTAPKHIVGTLVCSDVGIAELQLPDGTTLPPGYYIVSLTKED